MTTGIRARPRAERSCAELGTVSGLGSKVELEVTGADEADALAALKAMIADKFGEGK